MHQSSRYGSLFNSISASVQVARCAKQTCMYVRVAYIYIYICICTLAISCCCAILAHAGGLARRITHRARSAGPMMYDVDEQLTKGFVAQHNIGEIVPGYTVEHI